MNIVKVLKSQKLNFFHAGWSPDFGGMTSYIAKDEDEEVCEVK